jgi:hypothetical protein
MKRRSDARVFVVAVATVLLTMSCASPKPEPAQDPGVAPDRANSPRYVGELFDLAQLPEDFLWLQRVSGSFQGEDYSLKFALEKRGAELRVVGLSPFGTRAFLIRQQGRNFSFESYTDRPVPFSPKVVLIDVQRAFLVRDLSSQPPATGLHSYQHGAEAVRESWRDAALEWREFTHPDFERPIRVEYEPPMRDFEPPALARLRHGWFGYEIVVETSSRKRL